MRNHSSRITMLAAMVCGLLLAGTSSSALAASHAKAQAKAASKTRKKGETISGKVVDSKGQPVEGARVHFKHRHRPHKSHSAALKANQASQKQALPHKTHRHVVRTKADGTFKLHAKHVRPHTIVAHKKGVGRGHVRVAASGKHVGDVTIRLHKHRHSHSGHAKTKTKAKGLSSKPK